jgi:hypothetical protein
MMMANPIKATTNNKTSTTGASTILISTCHQGRLYSLGKGLTNSGMWGFFLRGIKRSVSPDACSRPDSSQPEHRLGPHSWFVR